MRLGVAARVAGIVLALTGLGASTVVGVSGGGAETAPDAAAAKVLAAAKRQVGDAYQWGGNGPDAWDCSGLTSVLWRTVGGVSSIPRTSKQQQAWAWPIREQDARPGDLVFFGDPVGHVAFYAGDGRIVDASSSRGKIVERNIWKATHVRYGRVPRAGVPHPKPPAPKPSASASAKPKPSATAKPAPKPTATKPAPKPSAKPGTKAKPPAKPAPKPSTKPTKPTPPAKPKPATKPKPKPKPAAEPAPMRPIPPAGHKPRTATTPKMAAYVKALRTKVGAGWEQGGTGPRFDSAGLVRWAWGHCKYGTLPATPAAIEKLAKPVALRDLAVGDLVLYGSPAVHVAVYVGNGEMIDASKVLKKVSQRRVFASETVRFARLAPPRK